MAVWLSAGADGGADAAGVQRTHTTDLPPARKYNFDFLDNVRTPAPCGMPSGLDNNHTNLRVGEELDIHWHLSYPHQTGKAACLPVALSVSRLSTRPVLTNFALSVSRLSTRPVLTNFALSVSRLSTRPVLTNFALSVSRLSTRPVLTNFALSVSRLSTRPVLTNFALSVSRLSTRPVLTNFALSVSRLSTRPVLTNFALSVSRLSTRPVLTNFSVTSRLQKRSLSPRTFSCTLRGYFFEIRDQDNMVKARYPNSSFMGSEDGTSLHYKLTLPDKACDGCTFRMVRQAMEWGGSYLFWSCADINIMEADALPQSDMCSGHGTYQNGACSCEKLYTGEKCQFKEECESDEDCGQHGMCVDTQATSFPKHQCYCSAGWFGPQCQHQSAVSSPPSDMSVYTSRTFSPASASDVTVHYRLVQDEVEVVLKAKTVSWIGFGWRPAGAKASCQNFPDLGDDMYDMSKADGGAEAEGESEAEASAEGHNSTAEAEPGSDGNATAEAEAKAEAEGHNATAEAESNAEAEGHNSTAEAESKAEAEGNSTAEAESKAEAEGHNATAEAESNAGAEGHNSTAEAESKAEAGQNSTAEAESNAEAEGHNSTAEAEGHNSTAEAEAKAEAEGHNSTAEAEAKAEGEGHNATAEGTAGDGSAEAEGAAEGEAEAEGGSALHPMDCTDLVIGSARGGYSRIGDYYTRDRSTPVHDEYLGGRNDLTAALVWEEGEHTFMLFRKKLTSDDPADHSLLDEQTHVLWAIGQERNAQGRYNHNPNTPSALETENVVITDFYRLDELKYHGHSGQRGAATLNFYPDVADDGEEPDNCMQGSCSKKVCGFDFSWVYDPESDTITFTISAKYVAPDQWLAIGFSDDVNMPNTDVAYGGIGPDGAAFVKDGWLFDKKPPRMDDSQDVTLVSGQHVNSTTTLVFSRKRSTGDSDDLDLTQCRYVFFAKGGKVGANGAISKHSSTPTVSAEKICFGVCQAAATGTTYITPVTIRLPGAQFRDTYRDTDSQDYKQLVGKLQTVLEAHFRGRFGSVFDSVNIIELRPGSIVVVFEVVTKSTEGAAKVQQDMKTAAAELETQTIDGYGAVEFEQVADTYRADGLDSMVESDLLTEVEIIIIAVVLALVLVAFLIGICKFIEARRSKQNDKQRVMGETSSTSSGSKDTGKKGTMTYGQFMATSHDADAKHLPPYPAFGNPGYETAGYKNVP